MDATKKDVERFDVLEQSQLKSLSSLSSMPQTDALR
jgi:hypothetical protein